MQSVPPGSVCGSGWLVFEVLLPSRAGGLGGNRALWFTAADCLLGQDPRGTGPPGPPLPLLLDCWTQKTAQLIMDAMAGTGAAILDHEMESECSGCKKIR